MDDDARWETFDGESPSQFGCFGTTFWLVGIAAAVGLMWWITKTWPL